jgi:iron(III) transport system ATP-binding protein
MAISDRIMVMSMARIAQDGTPRGLYEQPSSHFVAGFIGDANIVPVTIESHQGEMASVRLGSLLLTLPRHGALEGAAELSIRPHAVLVTYGGDGLSGCITKVAYLGSHMEYWATIEEIAKELFVIAPDIGAPFAVGDRVKVRLAPGGVALLLQRYPK